jgi:hypothetical protein
MDGEDLKKKKSLGNFITVARDPNLYILGSLFLVFECHK